MSSSSREAAPPNAHLRRGPTAPGVKSRACRWFGTGRAASETRIVVAQRRRGCFGSHVDNVDVELSEITTHPRDPASRRGAAAPQARLHRAWPPPAVMPPASVSRPGGRGEGRDQGLRAAKAGARVGYACARSDSTPARTPRSALASQSTGSSATCRALHREHERRLQVSPRNSSSPAKRTATGQAGFRGGAGKSDPAASAPPSQRAGSKIGGEKKAGRARRRSSARAHAIRDRALA